MGPSFNKFRMSGMGAAALQPSFPRKREPINPFILNLLKDKPAVDKENSKATRGLAD